MDYLIPRFNSLLVSVAFYCSTNAICYWPNGDPTSQDVACRDTSGDTACCSPGFACLENGLCMVTPHVDLSPENITYVRGSCTDMSWKSSNCPNYCVRGDAPYGDYLNGAQGLVKCKDTGPYYYCADAVGGNCTAQEDIINILPGKYLFSTSLRIPNTNSIHPQAMLQCSLPSASHRPKREPLEPLTSLVYQ